MIVHALPSQSLPRVFFSSTQTSSNLTINALSIILMFMQPEPSMIQSRSYNGHMVRKSRAGFMPHYSSKIVVRNLNYMSREKMICHSGVQACSLTKSELETLGENLDILIPRPWAAGGELDLLSVIRSAQQKIFCYHANYQIHFGTQCNCFSHQR